MAERSLSELSPVLEEFLSKGKEVHMIPDGTSMLPFIKPKEDKVVLVQPAFPLKKHDVVLYRRKDGSLILHRIVKSRKVEYVLCGDNQFQLEKGIFQCQIIGLLKGFYHHEKYHDLTASSYRIYCICLPLRRFWLRFIYHTKVYLYKHFSKLITIN